MTTQEQVDLDYYATFPEDDGEPMAETQVNSIQMIDLQWALLELARRQGRAPVAVGGNQLMYWNPHNGREHVSPDVYMVLDYKPPLPAKWQTWIEGKFPEIVFEISSPSTWRTDVGEGWEDKPALYKRRGVREYYIYDPQAAVQPALRGYGWVDEQWQRYELLPSGGLWSPLLGAELRVLPMEETAWRPAGPWLRVLDPTTGEPIPVPDEQVHLEQQARLAEQQARLEAEQWAHDAEQHALAEQQARYAAESRAEQQEQVRHVAEERASAEEQARRAAEERARTAEAALAALLAQREGQANPPAAPGET